MLTIYFPFRAHCEGQFVLTVESRVSMILDFYTSPDTSTTII